MVMSTTVAPLALIEGLSAHQAIAARLMRDPGTTTHLRELKIRSAGPYKKLLTAMAMAIQMGASVDQLASVFPAHPTLLEAIPEAAR